MEEVTNQPSAAPVEAEVNEAPTQTLEDIAKELSVEQQAQNFVSSVQPQLPPQYQPQGYQQQPFNAPDPVTDPDGYRAFVARQSEAMLKLNSTVDQVASKIGEWEREKQEQRINQDVDRAVTKVNEKLKLDPDMVEVALELEYRKNPSFKKIWDARDRNPGALDRALEILSSKISTRYQVRQDPQLAENVRAAKSALQTNANPGQSNSSDDPSTWDQAKFDRWWASRGQDI